jgi:hypothetical protein
MEIFTMNRHVIQAVVAAGLMTLGVCVSPLVQADTGSCTNVNFNQNPIHFDRSWGSVVQPSGYSSVVRSDTSGGTSDMYIDLADSAFACIDANGADSLGNYRCINHDSTNDGSSVSDTSGDCNGSVELLVNFWFH